MNSQFVLKYVGSLAIMSSFNLEEQLGKSYSLTTVWLTYCSQRKFLFSVSRLVQIFSFVLL